MPNEHSTRLESDLQLVRDFAATASDDDRLALAEVLAAMSTNLGKARRCEEKVLSVMDVNEMIQREATSLGVPFAPLPVPSSPEVDTLREHLTHCRALLAQAIADSSVKEMRRCVHLIIRSEKNLFAAMNECGQYVTEEFCRRASREFIDGLDKGEDSAAWAAKVDAHLAAVGFELGDAKPMK